MKHLACLLLLACAAPLRAEAARFARRLLWRSAKWGRRRVRSPRALMELLEDCERQVREAAASSLKRVE